MSELANLVTALRAHVRRRRRMGERRAPVFEEPAPLPVAIPESGEPIELAPLCPDLESLRAAVARCTSCELCHGRTQTVFADGNGSAGVLFVGEAPGFHEDRQGLPFVGRAGQLLTEIIEKGMGLRREDVLICNVLKCRPPENRDPTGLEKRTCTPWLDRQIELANPRVIIPLGRHAAGHVLGSEAPLGRLRGRVHEQGGRKIIPTYHPAYLLRNPAAKKDCWRDIQLAMAELGLTAPGK
ncbi:MAG: uracil-DNA glycosylase [Planctomycetota bacterium]|nr:uracil-DNA glycosylase [Planctomycetota bacterium]